MKLAGVVASLPFCSSACLRLKSPCCISPANMSPEMEKKMDIGIRLHRRAVVPPHPTGERRSACILYYETQCTQDEDRRLLGRCISFKSVNFPFFFLRLAEAFSTRIRSDPEIWDCSSLTHHHVPSRESPPRSTSSGLIVDTILALGIEIECTS